MSNQLQVKDMSVQQYLEIPQVSKRIDQKLGIDEAKQFKAALVSAVSVNNDLAKCDPSTVLTAAFLGHSLDLAPSPQLGHYYIVPFNNRKKGVADGQFILGYKGYIQLAQRSGQYRRINALEIKEGEFVKFDPLTEEYEFDFIQDPDKRATAKTIGYAAYFEYINGFKKMIYWTRERMEHHADQFSPAFKIQSYRDLQAGKIPQKEMWKYSSFWYKDFDSMAKKTMLRQLISKWGIMSIDMQRGYEEDIKPDISYAQAQQNAQESNMAANASEPIDTQFEESPAESEPETIDEESLFEEE